MNYEIVVRGKREMVINEHSSYPEKKGGGRMAVVKIQREAVQCCIVVTHMGRDGWVGRSSPHGTSACISRTVKKDSFSFLFFAKGRKG